MMKLDFKLAKLVNLPDIIALLADDELGALREEYKVPLPQKYHKAFNRITEDNNQELVVVFIADELVGTMQLSFIPYLTYQGGIRTQIEAVRIKSKYRGKGIGEKMFLYAIKRAKNRNAHVVQLTTDKQRPDAIRFYEKLGFKASHEGMKLHLK